MFRIRRPGERDPKLEKMLFEAYGIERDDIVWSPVPVRVDRLVAAAPQWHNKEPYYADPLFAETWSRIRSGLESVEGPVADRVFISRKSTLGNRVCENSGLVEDYFRGHGFAIVFPEEHSLAEQAAIFEHATVVAGFGGSALFNVMFCKRLEKLIVLTHEAYTARNEHLYGALLGAEVHYVWSSPQIPHPVGGWTEEAYFSNWTFNFDRNRSVLDTIVS